MAQKTSKPLNRDLAAFVQEAKKMGLPDEEIRKTATQAGWGVDDVDKTLTETKVIASAPGTDAAVPRDRGVPEGYVIGAGDVLQIVVWKEPDASVPSVVVRPDGKIALPLVKEIEVAGLTPVEAEHRLTEKLQKLIVGADVTVIVTQVNSKKIYVIGAVKKEGPIPIKYRMTVLQALTEAGGITDFAKRKKIYILRTENGRQYRLPFNYEEVIRGEHIEQNIWVTPDDTIVVPN